MSREEGTDGSKEGIDLAAALHSSCSWVLSACLLMRRMRVPAVLQVHTSPRSGQVPPSLGSGYAGLSELADYGLRFLSGYLTDRTRKYWLIAFIGFGLNSRGRAAARPGRPLGIGRRDPRRADR